MVYGLWFFSPQEIQQFSAIVDGLSCYDNETPEKNQSKLVALLQAALDKPDKFHFNRICADIILDVFNHLDQTSSSEYLSFSRNFAAALMVKF